MANSTTLRTGRLAPYPPPRFTGEATSDFLVLQEYLKQLQAALMDSGLGDPAYQFALVSIDPDSPPDPTLTTIARAQATANLALARVKDLEARVAALEGP